ncbi:MAG: AAC(3) family N-acetyltransferase [Chloroflexi bacterium]|nr:AAC(3) family N-acetyltransferase [Chloroflexota bacterium]
MVTFQELISKFKELGLRAGDTVLVHSSFKSFGGVEGGPQIVIDTLLHILGKDGTLVIPTFTFSFCDQYNQTGNGHFDVDQTPSEMGILTEIVRKMPGVKRSINPIYSVAVYGKLANDLASVNDKNVFGKGSIFAKLHELDAKIMIIGLSYNNSWTFVHYIEEMEGCDYRYHKSFSGTIVAGNKMYKDTFIMRVRDLERRVLTAVDPMGEILEKRGIVNIIKIGESTVKLFGAKDAYRITAEEMKKNPRLLYTFQGAEDG